MISKFFIEHPVLANVLAIVLVILGAVSLLRLPVAQYPNVTPPTVQVTTRYPGASPQTVVNTIALPIELQVNGVPGMLYMQSTSAYDGTYVLTVTFAIGSDPNMDQVLVQNRVQNAMAQLPQAVQSQGVAIRAKSSSILEFVTLSSPDKSRDALFMWNYATINLVNELARLPGVGNVNVMGAGEYSMRIWMDPNKLYSFGLVPEDVIRVVRQQSQEVAAGQVGMPPAPPDQSFQYTVDIKSRLDDPKEFGDIIVKDQTAQGGRLVRLKDVARIDLGAQTYSQDFNLNGKPAAGIAIYQTPDANSLKVAAEVDAKMKELSRHFPPGLEYSIPYNTTIFVRDSIAEVYKTLWQAGVLVLIVILVFLQNFRATLVPATTVPVTIIAAFAAMAVLGYTVNLSTLFALILAIGIVVDDAIVIVEGVSKYIEQGMSGHDASIRAMDELFGPIVGITLVLMAVFLPSAFVPGLSGQIFAQFALVIAATALISAVNAATLKPTQCALWLQTPKPVAQRNLLLSRLRACLSAHGARLCRVDRADGAACRACRADRGGAGGGRGLGHRSPADRVHPERGPGLSDDRRATARRRFARADDGGAGQGDKTGARDTRCRPGHRDIRACRRSTTLPTSPMPGSPLSCSSLGTSAARQKGPTSCRSPSVCKRGSMTPPTGGCLCWRRRRSRASATPAGFRCRPCCSAAASTTKSLATPPTRSSKRPRASRGCSTC